MQGGTGEGARRAFTSRAGPGYPMGSVPRTLCVMTVARARSILEMQFAASLEPCARCGGRPNPQALALAGQGDAWALSGDCEGCGQGRAFTFRSSGDPLSGAAPRDELGGPSPSEIIQPAQFVAEIERLRPLIHLEPTTLSVSAWRTSRDANRRVLVCAHELLKFMPPERALGTWVDPRYTRSWAVAVRDTCLRTRARYVADLPRVEALMKADGP